MSDGSPVILVHGLWYRAWSLRVLQRRLAGSGFETHAFSYPTRTRSCTANAAALADFTESRADGAAHFVAHSLGGLVVLGLLARDGRLATGRLVLLGTPLRGSSVARRLAGWPVAGGLLGLAAETLQTGCAGLPPAWETGMIAGTRPLGLGRLVTTLQRPHDGTVAVAETRAPGLADHLQLPVTHTGMLVSEDVATAAARFLRQGCFREGSL